MIYGCLQPRELWFIDFNHVHLSIYIYTVHVCIHAMSQDKLLYIHVVQWQYVMMYMYMYTELVSRTFSTNPIQYMHLKEFNIICTWLKSMNHNSLGCEQPYMYITHEA